MNINAWIGDSLGIITAKELIDRGILSPVQIINVLIKYPLSFIKANKNRSYPEEVSLIENLKERNIALDEILSHQKEGQNTLILFTHLAHLNSVEQYIKEKFPNKFKISKITGAVSGKKRDKIRTNLEVSENEIILAIYKTCEAGMDVKKLHNIILAASSKSKVRIIQSIGRSLRKHSSKNKAFIWDLVDDMTITSKKGNITANHLYKQWAERLNFYNDAEYNHRTVAIHLPEIEMPV